MLSFKIKFSCQRCGECCRSQRPGEAVVLYEDDVETLSTALGVEPDDFVLKHTTTYEYTYVDPKTTTSVFRLILPCEEGCPFLHGALCSVHKNKPFQCRAWPFIEPRITDKAAFHAIGQFCRGYMNGDQVPSDVIALSVEEQKHKEADYFAKLADGTSRIHRWVFSSKSRRRFFVNLNSEGAFVLTQELFTQKKKGDDYNGC